MGKVIEVEFKQKMSLAEKDIEDGERALSKLTVEERLSAINVGAYYAAWSCGVGLGLMDWEDVVSEEPQPENLKFFDLIDSLYAERDRMGGCYMCDHGIEPTETPFDKKEHKICNECVEKMSSFFRAINIQPEKVVRKKE